jgi:hypothetical protein
MKPIAILNPLTQQEDYRAIPAHKQENAFSIFGCLWAIAIFFHIVSYMKQDYSLNDFLLTLSLIYFLSCPFSLQRFVLLTSCQLYTMVSKMPHVSNHWLLVGFVNATIVLSYILLVIKQRNLSVSKFELYKTFAPAVRIEVLILYFFAVFHKLNTDFLFSDTSCSDFFYAIQNSSGYLPTSKLFMKCITFFALFIEFSIPILLSFRRTLVTGLFLGVCFHFTLAYNSLEPFYNFSGTIFALYFLFVPIKLVNQVWESFKTGTLYTWYLKISKIKYSFSYFAIVGSIGLVVISILYFLNERSVDFFRNVVWTAYGSIVISFVLVAFSIPRREWEHSPTLFSVNHVFLWVMPAIVFLNGACPYLGLKTESSFAMFSNLRTEGNRTNHLIVPVSMQIFNFQKQIVEIITSSDPKMQKLADDKQLITLFELERFVGEHKGFSVSYLLNGKRVNVTNTSSAAEFARPLSGVLKRLLCFRTINKYDNQPCSH